MLDCQTIIGDFSREQERFVSEHYEKKKQSEAAVPPWVGYNEEETMKTQILALSKVLAIHCIYQSPTRMLCFLMIVTYGCDSAEMARVRFA